MGRAGLSLSSRPSDLSSGENTEGLPRRRKKSAVLKNLSTGHRCLGAVWPAVLPSAFRRGMLRLSRGREPARRASSGGVRSSARRRKKVVMSCGGGLEEAL